MIENAREKACWLLLVYESGLTTRIVNSILATWCKQQGKSLEEFFAADAQEWSKVCPLNVQAIQKLELARDKLTAQAFLVEQLQHEEVEMMTVLDVEYPTLLKKALDITHLPPILFYRGNLALLQQQTIGIIGSRKANERSLEFTRKSAEYLSRHGVNVISGYARGVDREAFEGAKSGQTTIVLPHGIHKLSKVQMKELHPRILQGQVLLLSQFHPDATWLVSRAMERNNVVTGLAQIVIVAESDTKGGTWEGAMGALKQKREVYVRDEDGSNVLAGNKQLISKGGKALCWTQVELKDLLAPIVQRGHKILEKQRQTEVTPGQLSLLAMQPHN